MIRADNCWLTLLQQAGRCCRALPPSENLSYWLVDLVGALMEFLLAGCSLCNQLGKMEMMELEAVDWRRALGGVLLAP